MTWLQISALAMLLLLIFYLAVEFGWGGGDPNHPGHNKRHGPF